MTGILEKIVAAKRVEIAALKRAEPLEKVRAAAQAAAPALDFAGALRGARPRGGAGEANIIAELKNRSPSKGEFPWHGDVTRQVRAYEQGGAKAISVLTDEPFFGGSPQLLREIKVITGLPVLQKEFVLDAYQVVYARALGADALLLIARILPGSLLGELVHLARECGLATLVEVVDGQELARAAQAGAEVIGVNNRDLGTFTTDLHHTLALLPHFNEGQVAITESGIHTREDVEIMMEAGVDGFLIGEALMVAPDPAAHLRMLRGLPQTEAAS
ncbi:MAG: indole-3-glycerol phosphate synthase TrpC [SAR324 cluster bacterium]|nr:indole-3-glycerol phosphate synthase TrpC [SAR324 cluster bacterium]